MLKAGVVLSALFFSLYIETPSAWAEEAIYRCEGVYQNRPCRRGVSGKRVKLPKINTYSSERSIQSPWPTDIRARLGEIMPEQSLDSAVDSPQRQFTDPKGPDLREREQDVDLIMADIEYLSDNASRAIDRFGMTAFERAIMRLRTQLNIACDRDASDGSFEAQEECNQGQRLLSESLSRLREEVSTF